MMYQLLDSGDGQKLERFGEYTLLRPCAQAVWRSSAKFSADAVFTREEKWVFHKKLPKSWTVMHGGVEFQIAPTDFGHLGLFPEHADLWEWMRPFIQKKSRILNLFAYSGGVTIAAAQEGAEVCHLDASKGMVDWARENASLNQLQKAPIRWIVDDVLKFLKREKKRKSLYDAIILDPPTFGRGSQGGGFLRWSATSSPFWSFATNFYQKSPFLCSSLATLPALPLFACTISSLKRCRQGTSKPEKWPFIPLVLFPFPVGVLQNGPRDQQPSKSKD